MFQIARLGPIILIGGRDLLIVIFGNHQILLFQTVANLNPQLAAKKNVLLA